MENPVPSRLPLFEQFVNEDWKHKDKLKGLSTEQLEMMLDNIKGDHSDGAAEQRYWLLKELATRPDRTKSKKEVKEDQNGD